MAAEVYERKYIHMSGFTKCGNLRMHYGEREKSHILTPTFKIMNVEIINFHHSKCDLMPGFLDVNNNFYQCPIAIHYIQINKIRQEVNHESGSKNIVIMDFNIFKKDFSESTNHVITIDKTWNAEFTAFNQIINELNAYIHLDNDIDKVDFEKYNNLTHVSQWGTINIEKPNTPEEFIHIITNAVDRLQFDHYYEDSMNGPKEDNLWITVEIRNLPTNTYLRKLLISQFEKLEGGIVVTNFGITYAFKCNAVLTYKAYEPNNKRRAVEWEVSFKQRENLKVRVAYEFNSNEYLFSLIEKQ